jgi:hypothetical protein
MNLPNPVIRSHYGNGFIKLGIKYQVQRLKKSVDAPCFSSAF